MVMGIDTFERRELYRLQEKLAVAEQARLSGQPTVSLDESRKRLEALYGKEDV